MMMRSKENKNEKSPLPLQPHPWLVICPSGKTQTFFSISEDRCYERSIHELGNTTIRASAQEWLVLEDFDSTDCFLWNPISNDKIQLPPLPYNHNLLCLLSAPPNDPQCRVLFLIHETTPPDDDVHNKTTPPDDDIDTNDNENPNDYTDTNDDDTDDENPEDDDDTDPSNDDDTDPSNDDNPYDDDDTDSNDDDIDNENLDDDTDPSNDENPYDDDDTDSNDDDIDNENLDDVANDDNLDGDDDETVPLPALYLCKPGYDEEFHKQDLKSIIGDNVFLGWTVFKGDFYVLTMQTSILLRLDVDDSSGTISATPMTNQPPYTYFTQHLDMPRFENYLIQSEDELLYIYILFYGRELEDVYKIIVFRFDFVNQVWEEVKSIGETVIFLGPYSGGTGPYSAGTTCCTRGTNIKKESIYFTKGRYLYHFNLEPQSISVSLPCPHISMKNPHSYWLTLMAAN
ncbi:hypothetical protein KY284_035274 [Solanum tuberosum]|nr:hypothetical protein KY284_035274 [Solanum tuberosum]